MASDISIRRVTARVYRAPLSSPVMTSFGVMRDRPMVIVEVEDRNGATGFGEVWCNFPAVGAEHRARLVDSALAPLLLSRSFVSPREAFVFLTERTEVLALQCAEPGPFAQAIAGLDTALWDLSARRAEAPLWWHLNAEADPAIHVYASGLNPDAPERLAARRAREGYTAFKLKIGFGLERDLANLEALRETLGADVQLMVDANQAWSIDTALELAPKLEPFGLKWLEEPIRADRPWPEWHRLRAATSVPLAGGENLAGAAAFQTALAEGALGVVQPDLAKWGGISGTAPVARAILKAGKRFCPHYLGGGVGLLASAHLLAAAGGDGLLEIDANPNPLREMIATPLQKISNGAVVLPATPGLGAPPDLGALERFLVPH